MEQLQTIPIETRTIDVKGTRHAWLVRVTMKLTERQKDRLRLALYWYEHMPVDDKESLVEGTEQLLCAYDYEVFLLKAAAERAGLLVEFQRLPDDEQIAMIEVTKVARGSR
ncbi:MAG: hypothetical protein AABO58_01035 [Acidobacteriota bacterium]